MHPRRAPKKRHLPALRNSKNVFLVESFLGTFCWVSNGHALKYSSNCLGFSDRGSFSLSDQNSRKLDALRPQLRKKLMIWSLLLFPLFLARTLNFKQKMFVHFDSKFKIIPTLNSNCFKTRSKKISGNSLSNRCKNWIFKVLASLISIYQQKGPSLGPTKRVILIFQEERCPSYEHRKRTKSNHSEFKTLLGGAFGSCIEEDVQHE